MAARRLSGLGHHYGGRDAAAEPVEIVQWNSDKHYVGDLLVAGVPAVPTQYVEVGDIPSDLPEVEFVVKPTVSAAARGAARYAGTEAGRAAARRHIGDLHAAGRAVMIQPYQAAIDAQGERALVFLDGTFSHAIRKDALLELGVGVVENRVDAHPNRAAYTPTLDELAVARRALAAVPAAGHPDFAYGRVDLVTGTDGRPVVMELELIEPNLFLGYGRGSAERLAAAVASRVTGEPPQRGGAKRRAATAVELSMPQVR